MIAVVGDAEMDEGNMYEAILEGWKHDLRNCWWIIDYNRQSLDGVVHDKLFRLIDRLFRAAGWRVIIMKYGKRMRDAFKKPGGKALKFYASVRIDIRRKEILKDASGTPIGNHVKTKIVKNKIAPPFQEAEFDIMYNQGINKEGSILEAGVAVGV